MLKSVTVTTAAALFALSTLAVAADSSTSSKSPSSVSPSAASPSSPSAGTGSSSDSAIPPSFSSVDTNNDGQISRAEWDAHFNKSSSGGTSAPAKSPSSTTPAPTGGSSGSMGSGSTSK